MKKRIANQVYVNNDKQWSVARLIALSKKLEVFQMPLRHLNIVGLHPEISTIKLFVEHIQDVLDADLTTPIIMDEEGYVMDGRHRIARALLENKKTILAVRFEKTPECCHNTGSS